MSRVLLGLALSVMVASPVLAQKSTGARSEVSKVREERGWGLYLDHTTDDGCYIAKVMPTMTYRIQHDPSTSRIYVMIFSHRWQSLEEEKKYPLSFTFDRNDAWDVDAMGLKIGGVPGLAFYVSDTNFVDEMSSSHFVTFVTGDKLVGTFDLEGSSNALTMLGDCMKEMQKARDPFATGPSRIPPPVFVPKKPEKPKDDPFGT